MRTVTLQSPPYAALSIPPAPSSSSFSFRNSTLFFNTCLPQFRASSSASTRFALDASSIQTASTTELDAVSAFSEIVPDTVIFDDFEKFPPTAATVSSSLLLGICGLPDTIFRNAVDMALADSECYGLENTEARLSCFSSKALVNVGGDMAKLVPGRVSTEVDARLAYDTHAIIRKVHDLLKLYNDISIPPQRLLFKIPSTWQVNRGCKIVGVRGHTNPLDFCLQVTKAYNYIHKYGHKSKLMAAAVRNKQDLFSLLGVDYIIAPLKILQSLKESIASPDEKYSFVRKLSPQSAASYVFRDEELVKWDQASLAAAMGPAAVQLLATGLDGHADQAKRVEELLGKIWPPPNV
ncbi:uncharacterized protein LOC107630025 isoform X1 [Arachis ipaensis]|uniref:uncharacterized protein LOC107630025 isoform X1 n=1 Tax=Arachis ipaensis TaxID=130454 RepID=UPI000A2B3767|nr:uncharacterized protein LOC107630025 isoform X1 [Arachis ipaensis]